MKLITILLLLASIVPFISYGQQRKFKCEKVYDAVKLIDKGEYDQAIEMLKDCEKMEPENYVYAYEIALALTYKKEYQQAINKLEELKNNKSIQAEVYQLLGNDYDYLKQTEKALAAYDEGLKIFPAAGRLYLEKGVVYESAKKYVQAIKSYEDGIRAEPMYPSNYYRAARLYLNSNDKLAGIIYGEIFMNIERSSKRTLEMSKMLFDAYKNSLHFQGNSIKADFCDIVVDAAKVSKDKVELPFCAIFGKHLMLSVVGQDTINLNSLAQIRSAFISSYCKEDIKVYPNVLFSYLKKLSDANLLETYTRYIFQMGESEGFETWKAAHASEFDKFVEWYAVEANYLQVDTSNVFISDSIK